MKIVDMCIQHIEKLAELEKICFSSPWSENGLNAELENENSFFVVAVEKEEILGYAGMHIVIDECYIANIAVFPVYRGRGIATALLDRLDEIAESKSAEFISLEVRPSNLGAVKLYLKNGYTEAGRRKNFYTNPFEDGLILTKKFVLDS